jgi:uncharacterized protein involved in exopolysaccharide biosynthesis
MQEEIQENTEEYSLIDLFIDIGQEKWRIIAIIVITCMTGVIVSLVSTETYTARTTMMPITNSSLNLNNSNLSTMSLIAGVGGLTNGAFSIKSSEEMLIALMRSYTVQAEIIAKLNLKERYSSKNMTEARIALDSNVEIITDKKSGLLIIEAQDVNPKFSAELAQIHINELKNILSKLSVTEAQGRRQYYENQIIKIHYQLPILTQEFKNAQKESGVEVASILTESNTLPSQIATKELQMQIMNKFANPENPEVKKLNKEISALRNQLTKYELNKSNIKENNNLNNLQSDKIQKAVQLYNTIKIQEATLDVFIKQLENAKLDEAKDGPIIQIIDTAVIPDVRSKPIRRKIVQTWTIIGLVLSLIYLFTKITYKNWMVIDENKNKLIQLKKVWKLK